MTETPSLMELQAGPPAGLLPPQPTLTPGLV